MPSDTNRLTVPTLDTSVATEMNTDAVPSVQNWKLQYGEKLTPFGAAVMDQQLDATGVVSDEHKQRLLIAYCRILALWHEEYPGRMDATYFTDKKVKPRGEDQSKIKRQRYRCRIK